MNFKKAIKTALVGLAIALVTGVAHADNFSVSAKEIREYGDQLSVQYTDDDVQCTIWAKMSAKGYARIHDKKVKRAGLEELRSWAGIEMMSYESEMETDLDGHSFENWMLLRKELREIYMGAYIQGGISRLLTDDPSGLSTIKERSQMVDDYFDYCLGRKAGAEKEGIVSSFNYYLALARVANGDF